jgi:hypothetical protein
MVAPSLSASARRPRTLPRRSSPVQVLAARSARWLAPPLRDTARLTPSAKPVGAAPPDDFRRTLGVFAPHLRHAWLVAVVRRALICGLAAGLIVALLAVWAGGPRWCGPLIALLVTVGAVLWSLSAAPGEAAAARFLDYRLNLKEQIATALELSTGPEERARSPLGSALRRTASDTMRAVSGSWSVRAAVAGREWAVGAALLALLLVAVAAPFGGSGRVGTAAGPSPAERAGAPGAPIIPAGPANSRALSVQIAVVSTPSTAGTTAGKTAASAPKRHASAAHPGVLGSASHAGSGHSTATSPKAGGGAKAGGKGAATNPKHLVPLIQGSKGFLPTSPSAKGQSNGTFTGAPTKAGKGSVSANAPGGTAGASSSKSASGSSAGGKGNAARANGGGKQGTGAGASGKQGASSHKAVACTLTYACARLNPKALTAPGLITGKGRFTGHGGVGGQTAGNAKGAAPSASKAKTASPTGPSKQLRISSAYGANKASGKPARQVQGHNGAGRSQPTTVTPGANSGQTVDYVPPDANIVQPSEAGIVSRYFVPSSASKRP